MLVSVDSFRNLTGTSMIQKPIHYELFISSISIFFSFDS